MKLKKQKKIAQVFKTLKKLNYPEKLKIVVTPAFITKFNRQKHQLSFFHSIDIKNPNLCISKCAYQFYKGEHKKKNIELLAKMSNHDKKVWNKNRFVGDILRFCTIKKCEHEEYSVECILDLCRRKKYILAYDKKEIVDEVYEMPFIKLENSELKLNYNSKKVDEDKTSK